MTDLQRPNGAAMVAVRIRPDDTGPHPSFEGDESLSGFERRCLLKHICECHELIQLTILGAGTAYEKAGGVPDLERICDALKAAERLIERAEQLAVLQVDRS